MVKLIKTRLKYKLGIKKIKVGHAGTLDPLATGLLVIAIGRKTKSIPELMADEKVYTGEIFLGATRPSIDKESEIDQTYSIDHIEDADIKALEHKFIGEIEQVPPIFSALKIDGKRAYESARKGEEPEMKKRLVQIHEIKLERSSAEIVKFRVKCGKGTYIRSLARDIGESLKTGAYLNSLRREQVGLFDVADAIHPKSFLDPDFEDA